MPKKKPIPDFESEDAESEFWAERDSTDVIDWSKAERLTLAKLKPSTKTISVRLPEALLDDLKLLANKRDVPYQSLLKLYLAERVEKELRHPGFGSWKGRDIDGLEHQIRMRDEWEA